MSTAYSERRTSHSWMESAVCRHVTDPGIFHDSVTEESALAVCAICPVIASCFAYIHDLVEFSGIAAGTVWRDGNHPRVPCASCPGTRCGTTG
ncbi:WhiB family transcriptional regulator [Streptomyces sp. NBC_00102]|uniref:WhiB family transcriptional regulator n=1 Tax=Streptomyces sp. NBC_00102 TaxID=2975652 RepID=UPI002254D2BC|nr:WhiB family transcriptional regulator [Streptomyces sp. NBC_00102]MCX5400481.1 WhiB family transcriptional regulator [Streptomyces sp. NBC_00102]